jgi:uncharacterized protein (TIGR03067 family)
VGGGFVEPKQEDKQCDRCSSPAYLALISVSALCAEKETPESVAQALKGDWTVVGIEDAEMKATPDELRGMQWSIEGDMISASQPGVSGKMRFKVDPTQSPKHFDITSLDGNMKGSTDIGIYELENDRLRICLRDSANKTGDRPNRFADAAPGKTGYWIISLKKKVD